MRSSDRIAGLARHFLYLSNQATATSVLHFPYEWCTNSILDNNWIIIWDISWPIPLLCGVSASFVLWNNG